MKISNTMNISLCMNGISLMPQQECVLWHIHDENHPQHDSNFLSMSYHIFAIVALPMSSVFIQMGEQSFSQGVPVNKKNGIQFYKNLMLTLIVTILLGIFVKISLNDLIGVMMRSF
jgi:hypothetical protein